MIDTAKQKVIATIAVGAHPYCVALNADGSRAYVSNTLDDTLSVIDTARHQTIDTIEVGGTPEGVSFSPTHNQVYVASWQDDEVTVVDAALNKVASHIHTGKESRAFGQFVLENAAVKP